MSASSRPRTRKTFVMQLKSSDVVPAYRKAHDEIWPEMKAVLKDAGAHNYSISLHPTTLQLFAFVEIESQERWDAVASTAVCQRWWVAMAPMMETQGIRPVATELTEVFFLE